MYNAQFHKPMNKKKNEKKYKNKWFVDLSVCGNIRYVKNKMKAYINNNLIHL